MLTEESILNNMVARVEQKCKAMKISQKAFAEQAGVSYSSFIALRQRILKDYQQD